jgi:hypothetical protein
MSGFYNRDLTGTVKFIFICIPISPEIVTTFNAENVTNKSMKAACKQDRPQNSSSIHKNKLHVQTHTHKHTQVTLRYEDDIQLLLKLHSDSVGSIRQH